MNHIVEEIVDSILESQYIGIIRDKFSGNKIQMFPLIANEKFVLGLRVRDFTADGFVILKVSDITEIERNKTSQYFEYILKAEKQFDKRNDLINIDLDSWETIFKSLQDSNLIVELVDDLDDALDIGEVRCVDKNSLKLRCFNTIGVWDDENIEISYENITSVVFLDNYSCIFSKYLRSDE